MRRFLNWLMVLVLVVSCTAIAEGLLEKDASVVDFDATILNGMELTAEEWMSEEEYRAAATIFISLNLAGLLGDESNQPNLTEASFLGRNDQELILYVHTGNGDVVAFCCPDAKEASYKLVERTEDDEVENALAVVCPNGYYRNDIDVITKILIEGWESMPM